MDPGDVSATAAGDGTGNRTGSRRRNRAGAALGRRPAGGRDGDLAGVGGGRWASGWLFLGLVFCR
jgi:hypothetical protein